MPGSQGTSAFERLREASVDVPIVVISGEDDPALIRQAIDPGASGDQRIAQLECRESAEVAICCPQLTDPMGQAQRSDSGVVCQRTGHPTL